MLETDNVPVDTTKEKPISNRAEKANEVSVAVADWKKKQTT